ncbi:MAG: protease modulator HflC [Planctomycetota bacterium]
MSAPTSVPGGDRTKRRSPAIWFGVGLLVLLLLLLGSGGIYSVDAGEQAVVLQFGKPVSGTIDEPGVHFKLPFVQDVVRFDKRILSWDGNPGQVPTGGREFISVDTTARWRIADPLQFLKAVRTERDAQSRLDDVLDSAVRDVISRTELVEIVRSAEWKVDPKDLEREVEGVENQTELLRPIKVGREGLERAIMTEASKAMPGLGIELVDVRIKRLNYVDSVQQQVFLRMVAERQRVAAHFRSEGEGDASRIRGEAARELATIRSEAKRQAEVIRGEADAEATRIYAEAYGKSPEFFTFLRTLESYGRTLGERTTLIMGGDSDYFQLLEKGGGR